MVPIIANLKPEVRVEEDKGATGPHVHPALCRPQGQGYPATIQLQRQGGHCRERRLGQEQQRGQDQGAGRGGGGVSETGAASARQGLQARRRGEEMQCGLGVGPLPAQARTMTLRPLIDQGFALNFYE